MNQSWELLPQKALHWPAQRAAIVADVHIGKAASFRHHGVPVPRGTTTHDLARLSTIISQTRCERLIILGDLLHAHHGRDDQTMRAVTRWRAVHASLDILLVRGNHDHSAGDPPADWRMQCVDEPHDLDGVALRHAPVDVRTADALALAGRGAHGTIAGHVHPCVRMRDSDGSSIRAACFVISPRSILMPAFGSFTGTHPVQPREGDRVFVVGGDVGGENTVVEATGVCAAR
jgi:DNA ligase-associated metallophosphoesterase